MSKIINTQKRYYCTIDTLGWDNHKLFWLTNKKIENVIKHKVLGYCAKIYESDIEDVKKNKSIKLTVWPDGDSYTFVDTFKINGIYAETETLEEV